MGRARITLKLISNERSRRLTFKSRREILIKKTSEFSTLCGVEACLIVYDDGNGDIEPVTCPKDPVLAHSILQNYEFQKNQRPPKKFGIQDFVEDRKNIIEAEISKVHKEITNIKYPTSDPSFINMEEDQLRAFIALVDAKIRTCDHSLKNMHQSEANFMQNMAWGSASSSHPTPMEPLNNNGRVDVTNSIDQVYEAMQQVDAPFSYIPDMVQKSFNCLQNISQSQPILDVEDEMVGFSNRVDVSLDTTNQIADLLDWFDGPIIGWSDLVDWTSQPDESQNEQQGGGDLDGFQTECYNLNF